MARPEKKIEPDESLTDDVFTVAEASAFLKVHRSTLYRLIDRDGLPCHLVGSDRRFIRKELLEWLAAR